MNSQTGNTERETVVSATLLDIPAAACSYGGAKRISVEDLCMSQTFENDVETVEIDKVFPIRKPDKNTFVRFHSRWTFTGAVIETQEGMEKTYYVVHPELMPDLADEYKICVFFAYVTFDGELGFWPVKRSKPGTSNQWNTSAVSVVQTGKENWIRVISSNGKYKCLRAESMTQEPQWDKFVLKTCFEDAISEVVIEDLDHPVLRSLRGAV